MIYGLYQLGPDQELTLVRHSATVTLDGAMDHFRQPEDEYGINSRGTTNNHTKDEGWIYRPHDDGDQNFLVKAMASGDPAIRGHYTYNPNRPDRNVRAARELCRINKCKCLKGKV